MSENGHRIKHYGGGVESARAECTCGRWKSGLHEHRWQVEDEARVHLRNVEKAKAALARRQPSLASQARYYREKADDLTVSQAIRDQWRILAEELEARIAEKTLPDDDNQLPLF